MSGSFSLGYGLHGCAGHEQAQHREAQLSIVGFMARVFFAHPAGQLVEMTD